MCHYSIFSSLVDLKELTGHPRARLRSHAQFYCQHSGDACWSMSFAAALGYFMLQEVDVTSLALCQQCSHAEVSWVLQPAAWLHAVVAGASTCYALQPFVRHMSVCNVIVQCMFLHSCCVWHADTGHADHNGCGRLQRLQAVQCALASCGKQPPAVAALRWRVSSWVCSGSAVCQHALPLLLCCSRVQTMPFQLAVCALSATELRVAAKSC